MWCIMTQNFFILKGLDGFPSILFNRLDIAILTQFLPEFIQFWGLFTELWIKQTWVLVWHWVPSPAV